MQNVIINGVTYADVPEVNIPLETPHGSTTHAVFTDTSDATLTSGDQMLSGVSAYSKGSYISGTIVPKAASDLTVSGATVTVPAGYYSASASKSVASGSASAPSSITGSSASLNTGSNTLTLSKTISVTPVVSAGYVSAGTATNSTVSLTASVTTKGAATITPGTSAQTISSGTYLTGTQTISGDANLKASNIKSGVSIFGVAGSLTSAVVTQDSTTKVLTIE